MKVDIFCHIPSTGQNGNNQNGAQILLKEDAVLTLFPVVEAMLIPSIHRTQVLMTTSLSSKPASQASRLPVLGYRPTEQDRQNEDIPIRRQTKTATNQNSDSLHQNSDMCQNSDTR